MAQVCGRAEQQGQGQIKPLADTFSAPSLALSCSTMEAIMGRLAVPGRWKCRLPGSDWAAEGRVQGAFQLALEGQGITGQHGGTIEELLLRASRCVAAVLLVMERTAELPAAPSPFWSLLALLRREPGMEWLPCGPEGCSGPGGTGGPEAGSEEGADKLSQVPEKNSFGPWPLKALLLLEDSREGHLWQVYHEGLRNFLSFRESLSLSAVWPIPVEQIRKFLVAMESQDQPPTKIIMYMEGLSFISRMANHPDPLPDPLVCYMMSKLKQRTSRSNDEYFPVTIEVLRSLLGTLESVCSSPYECLLFRAIFTVAFFGVLHIGDMVANHQNMAQPDLLYLSDLQLTEGSATLFLHPAHMGQQRCLIRLRLRKELWVCPVEALRTYVRARPPGEGPLFVHSDSRAVTTREFLTVFRGGLRFAGLPPNQYAVHSFWLRNPNRSSSWVFPQSD